mgnify:CR=1 FL=1
MAGAEVALELGAGKSDQEDQMSSKKACKARSEAPLELGAKMSKVLEESKKNWDVSQANKAQQECQIPEWRKEESIAEGQPSSYPQH